VHPLKVSLKLDPEDSLALQADYPGVIVPGYHLNKKHWVTVEVEAVPGELVEQMVETSHSLVKPKVPRARLT
jgi:predicted DNA-binding protein (MmcQ/YjbR family)